MLQIERIAPPARRHFERNFVRRSRPVIVDGLIDSWPAKSWTIEFFRQHHASVPVVVEVWETPEDCTGTADYAANMRHVTMSLGEYIDIISSRGPSKQYYLVQVPILEKLPELKSHMRPLGYYSQLLKKLTIPELFWLGPPGTVTPCHFDFAHNFLIQVVGRKTVTLFSPDQARQLYFPHNLKKWNFSPVDVEKPDLEQFPLFRDARPVKCVLNPGDALFIPQGWWHHVRGLDATISLNFWFLTWSRAIKLAPGHIKQLVLHRMGKAPSPYDPS